MTEQMKVRRPNRVIGPDGQPITLSDLPSTDTKRWVIRRKAIVVAAVRGGLISLEEACKRYSLSVEEFLSWQRSIEKHGLPGLRVTRIQEYRHTDDGGSPSTAFGKDDLAGGELDDASFKSDDL